MKIVPIAKPLIGKQEFAAVKKVLSCGWITQGPKVAEFEKAFSHYTGCKYACAVSSCTAALHMALLAIGVKPGDTVITVSHSFIATANAIRYCGAEPVFVDIYLNTYNLSAVCLKACLENDCEKIQGKLFFKHAQKLVAGESPLKNFASANKSKSAFKLGRVAAILVVHQMGMPCDLKSVLKLASKFNLPVIEDAACAIGSEIKIGPKWEKIGKPHADIACFSFHPRKVITTGEGGMLTTNNLQYDKRFRLFRQHGMSMPDTVRHKAKKVIFEKYLTTGYNYRMTDIQAAIGIEQLKRLPRMIRERRRIADIYRKKLADIDWLELPVEPGYCKTNWQSYAIRLKYNAPLTRDRLMQYLLDAGISTRRGIMNAHQERSYIRQGWRLSNSELARDVVILLPIFAGMDKRQIEKITADLRKW